MTKPRFTVETRKGWYWIVGEGMASGTAGPWRNEIDAQNWADDLNAKEPEDDEPCHTPEDTTCPVCGLGNPKP